MGWEVGGERARSQAALRRSLVLALAVAISAASGCGARWTDEQQAELASRYDASTPSNDGRTVVTANAPLQGAGAAPAATGGGTAAPSGTVAAQGATSGPGSIGDPMASGTLPCAAPSDAPGVTDEEITVGSIATLTGPVPGLGASSLAAVRAYIDMRNSNGGVCGRRVVLREADDGLDNGRYRTIIQQMEPSVLGIVGGQAVGDPGGADIIADTRIPVVGVPTTVEVSRLPNVFDVNPPFESLATTIGKYQYIYDLGVREVALIYLAVDQSRAEANVQRSLMEAAGLRIVQVQELPVATLSYDSTARSLANSGAQYMWFIADAGGDAKMAQAIADIGYDLEIAEYVTGAYGGPFIDIAGGAAEGAVTFLRSLPVEEATSNAAMGSFAQWMDAVAPAANKDFFAIDSWASATAFFESLEALAGPITRLDLLAVLQAIETFDAGGMFGPIRFGAELTNGCVVGMRFSAGAWQRLAPANGFLC